MHTEAGSSETTLEHDSDAARHRLLVDITLSLLGLLGVPLVWLLYLLGNQGMGLRWQLAITLPLTLLLAAAARFTGRLTLAIHLLLWGLLLICTLQAALIAGLRNPATLGMLLAASLAAFLLSRRWAIAFLLVCLGGISLLAWLTPPVIPGLASPRAYWVALVVVICVLWSLSRYMTRGWQQQFAAVRTARDGLLNQIQALQRSQRNFKQLFSLVPAPVSIARVSDGRTLEANEAWCRLMGWSHEEAIGRTSIELGIWADPSKRADWVRNIREEGRLHAYQVRFRSRDGALHDMVVYAEPVEYQGEEAVIVAHLDITERLRAEEASRNLNIELEQRVSERTASLTEAIAHLQRAQNELVQAEKLASLGSMVAGMAHELNTPIGNALTVATTLHHDTLQLAETMQNGELRRSALERYVDDAMTASALIERSLARANGVVHSFKQVATDQSSEWRRQFDVRELLDDLLETLRPSFRHRNVLISTMAPPGILMDSYPGPLGQVIANLVENAVVHGLEGSEGGEVSLRVAILADDQIELRVVDNGRGISAEHISRIFDPFFTTRLGQGGSGLGLAVVYRLVTTLLGGHIRVESTLGEGSCFIVVLPRIAPPEANAEQTERSHA